MPTINTATITKWNQDRGFGFISDNDGSESLFLHAKELTGGIYPPVEGDQVTYQVGTDQHGRRQAIKAINLRKSVSLSPYHGLLLLVLMVLPAAALSQIPVTIGTLWIAAIVLVASFTTYSFYAKDKNRAQSGKWRISELRLHVLELIGGWPGAFIAQRRFRHKLTKGAYQFIFWVIIAGHQIAAIDILRGGEVSYTTWSLLRGLLAAAFPETGYLLAG